jgi:hypothetical protein
MPDWRVVTRRDFIFAASAAGLVPTVLQAPLIVPVHHIVDGRVKWGPEQTRGFWSHIWPEAVRDLGGCGIRLQSSLTPGEVWRPAGREPVISGLEPGTINFVITDQIPMEWDNGRALSGVTTRYRGYHLCMVALNRAHGHQIPLISVNTCVHELLHALLHDIFESRPKGLLGAEREFRIDLYATRLWLFRDGAAIRQAARDYVERLKRDVFRHDEAGRETAKSI